MATIPLQVLPHGFALDDKYTREDGTIYLSGVQALVRLPLDQHRADRRRGLNTATFISGYRGSPLGGFDTELDRAEKLLRQNHVVHQPGLNEELGATAVFGSQMASVFPGPKYDGVLGMWYGKGPGVDRTGDAFKHANYAGTGRNGGVLALGGDDPSSKSSTLPSDSTVAFYDALMPVLFPGNVQDVLDLGLHGFMLSRASGLWVGVKITTNVADGTGTATVAPDRITPVIPAVEFDGRPFEHRMNLSLLAPTNLELERSLHEARLVLAREYARENDLNRITIPTADAWLGIVAAGKTYYDVKDAFRDLGLDDQALDRCGIRVLKIGMLFPLEPRTMREFARGLQEILVVEEKRPFLEMFVRDALYSLPDRPAVVGKLDEEERRLLPSHSELDSELIARAIAARLERKVSVPSAKDRIRYLDGLKDRTIPIATIPRSPFYCSGCPHNRSTMAPEGSIVGGGIGCHSMALWMDPARFGELIGLTQMGGEGAQWVGISPFTETRHLFQNIGDGTLFHSGQMAINFAVASGVNITYKILYNSAVAMTGGQEAVGVLGVPDLTRRLATEGVKRIIVTTDDPAKYRGVRLAEIADVWDRDRLTEAHEALAAISGVTALIHDQQCAAEKRRLRKRGKLAEPTMRLFINERVCEGCGDCGKKSNCLSVQPVDTEFGRKTSIHQASCNKDYSCLNGDCPAFVSVELTEAPTKALASGTGAKPLDDLPDPELRVPVENYALHMMGIGGTGVVTVSQVLGTAALLDGLKVWGLDQTGLSQKGGPVVSDLRLSAHDLDVSKLSAGGADLYLGFDLLVAADQRNLAKAEPKRTFAVVSTSRVATGQMVTDTAVSFPEVVGLRGGIDSVTLAGRSVYLDAQGLSEALFGSHMPANLLLLGAAYQAGAVPISAAAIEQAIRLNGAAVEENLQAFRWGRTAVVEPARAEAVLITRRTQSARPRRSSAEVAGIIESAGATGELQRLIALCVPELVAYQNAAYARRYAEFVAQVARAEQERSPGCSDLAEAVARNLYKLMAYKDEYEVARLHLDAAERAKRTAEFGENIRISWNLHPPLLRSLGLKRKIRLGPWFTPGMQALRAMKRLRGTRLDLFGYAPLRRIERGLPDEYREMIEAACARLTAENHGGAVALAELPDMIRGYEQIKLDNVQRYREAVRELTAKLSVSLVG